MEDKYFHINTVGLLHEIADCNDGMGALRIPFNVLRVLLAQVAQRATELHDRKLDALMVRLGLYEIDPKDIPGVLEKLES